jgi:hypothetical protein
MRDQGKDVALLRFGMSAWLGAEMRRGGHHDYVDCSDLECSFSVVGNPLGNVDCIPGIQVPRGFYLIEFILSCGLTLESETGHKISNWHSQLAHKLVQKACLRSAWLCVLAKPTEAAGIPLWGPHLPRHPRCRGSILRRLPLALAVQRQAA